MGDKKRLKELKAKLSAPEFDNSGLDPVENCSSKCNFLLKDHAEGWSFWKTEFSTENHAGRIDAFFLDGDHCLWGWSEQYPDQLRRASIELVGSGIDIRNLVPITSEEYHHIMNEVADPILTIAQKTK